MTTTAEPPVSVARNRPGTPLLKRRLPVPGLVAVLAILMGWTLVTTTGMVRTELLPPPGAVLDAARADWDRLLRATRLSLWTALVGYLLGFGGAVVVGMAVGRYRRVALWANGLIDFSRAIPAVAMVPFALLVFGDSFRVGVFAVAWGCFFLTIINIIAGVRHVPATLEMAVRSYGGGELKVLRKVGVPSLLPFFLASLRQNIAVALIVVVVADMVIGLSGLGFYILRNQGAALFDRMYAAVVIISIVGYGSYKALELLQERMFPWWSDEAIAG